MRVTILTVAYNSENTISRAIESVMNQTYEEIEYIIVDGASSDHTAEIARSYQDQFNERQGRCMRVLSEPDRGMYDALNKGARLASGELVGTVNADDYYELDAVRRMVDFYRREHYDLAWGNIMIHKNSGDMVKKARATGLWTTSGFCHPAMFARREILLEFPYAQIAMDDDFDFVTRIHLAGKRNRQGKNPDGIYGDPGNLNDRKILTLDALISNYTFGGMSTAKSLRESARRIRMKYTCYRRHGMSPLYWFYCVAIEAAKYILG